MGATGRARGAAVGAGAMMTRIREAGAVRALLGVLAVWALVALLPMSAAQACSCKPLTFDEAVESADLIAEVRVERVEDEDGGGPTTYSVLVDRIWKGEASRRILFATSEETTACGLGRLEVGETFITWAHETSEHEETDADYSAAWCSLPMDGGGEAELTAALGEPRDLTDQEAPPLPWKAPGPIVVAIAVGAGATALGIAAIAVVGVLVLRRQRRTGR